MPNAHHLVDERVRAEIARAFRELRPHMIEDAKRDADLDPSSRLAEFSEKDLEQILNAYEAMFMEALEGPDRATRDFVLDTALPPILEMGQSIAEMARGNIISAVMLSHRLLPRIPEDMREDAARWLAAFLSGNTFETIERAQALRKEGA